MDLPSRVRFTTAGGSVWHLDRSARRLLRLPGPDADVRVRTGDGQWQRILEVEQLEVGKPALFRAPTPTDADSGVPYRVRTGVVLELTNADAGGEPADVEIRRWRLTEAARHAVDRMAVFAGTEPALEVGPHRGRPDVLEVRFTFGADTDEGVQDALLAEHYAPALAALGVAWTVRRRDGASVLYRLPLSTGREAP